MAPAEATVRSACNLLLAGIDEDVKEYIVEMFINGDDSGESLVEALKEFILSYEFCADAESSEAKARELMAAISPSSNAAGGAGDRKAAVAGGGASSAAPKLLEESVRLAEVGGELFKQPAQYELGGRLVGIEEAMEDRKKRKAAREEERRATRRMYDKVAAQRARDDQLLDAARVAAVRLRRERGAYLGAVEAKPFSMPNPGGGPDLLENASFTLQRGRRCVASDVVRPSCPSPPSTFFTRHACPPPAPPPCGRRRYGLIGRNGTGKSTLLRNLASRQVGDIPPALTIHYVSQEVKLDDAAMEQTPLQVGRSPVQDLGSRRTLGASRGQTRVNAA